MLTYAEHTQQAPAALYEVTAAAATSAAAAAAAGIHVLINVITDTVPNLLLTQYLFYYLTGVAAGPQRKDRGAGAACGPEICVHTQTPAQQQTQQTQQLLQQLQQLQQWEADGAAGVRGARGGDGDAACGGSAAGGGGRAAACPAQRKARGVCAECNRIVWSDEPRMKGRYAALCRMLTYADVC
jgi:hypothetical protein